MRGCADAGGMEEVTLFKRKVSDRSTVTPSERGKCRAAAHHEKTQREIDRRESITMLETFTLLEDRN